MKNKLWIGLALLLIIPGTVYIVSCAGKAIEADPSLSQASSQASEDDARQKDGLGVCGQRLCCASYLSQFRSITLRDVREQNLTPNPSKVSGVCGRLKCCLHFESDFYRKARKLYPQVGSKARIGKRTGEITSVDIFSETVTLRMNDDEERIMDIEKFHRKRKPLKKEYDSQKQSSDTRAETETP